MDIWIVADSRDKSTRLFYVATVGGHELSRLPISKPPVLLVHGSAEPIVPFAALHAAKAELEHVGIDVTTHISSGVGHRVDPVGLRMGGEFVVKALTN